MKIASRIARLGGLGFVALTLGLTGCHTGGRTMGQAVNDRMTAHDVKAALSDSPVYKFEDVKPQVFDGRVELTGFVQTHQQRQQAANIAAGVKGVREVVNDIEIMPTPTGRAQIRNGSNGEPWPTQPNTSNNNNNNNAPNNNTPENTQPNR